MPFIMSHFLMLLPGRSPKFEGFLSLIYFLVAAVSEFPAITSTLALPEKKRKKKEIWVTISGSGVAKANYSGSDLHHNQARNTVRDHPPFCKFLIFLGVFMITNHTLQRL